jgi:hypothetical protein
MRTSGSGLLRCDGTQPGERRLSERYSLAVDPETRSLGDLFVDLRSRISADAFLPETMRAETHRRGIDLRPRVGYAADGRRHGGSDAASRQACHHGHGGADARHRRSADRLSGPGTPSRRPRLLRPRTRGIRRAPPLRSELYRSRPRDTARFAGCRAAVASRSIAAAPG